MNAQPPNLGPPDSQVQIHDIQAELEKIIQVIEKAGGSILNGKEQVAQANGLNTILEQPPLPKSQGPGTPKSQQNEQNMDIKPELTQSHLKKRKIMVNFDAEPPNQQPASEQGLPQIKDSGAEN